MPLSEEEQRILQEMEQKLYEHDREFVDRVNHGSHRLRAAKGAKWSVAGFAAGFAVLLSTFRFSIRLAALGFFLMLISSLAFAQHLRQASTSPLRPRARPAQALAGELTVDCAGGSVPVSATATEERSRLRPEPDARLCLAVDIGGTKLAVGFVTESGELVFEDRISTPRAPNQTPLFRVLGDLMEIGIHAAAGRGRRRVRCG